MTDPFTNSAAEERLDVLRRRVRSLVWCSGLSRFLVVVVGAVVVAGLSDWSLQLQDRGLRVLMSLVIWTAAAIVAWRYLIQPLRVALTDVFLAQQIERRYPGLQGRVQSALEFQSQGFDPKCGSPALQQLVTKSALTDLISVEPQEVASFEPVRKILLAGIVVGIVAGTLSVTYPLEAATAVKRIAWPFGDTAWPRTTALQFLLADGNPFNPNPADPLRIVRGDTLRLGVINQRGPLPAEVWLEVRRTAADTPTRELLRRGPWPANSRREAALLELPISSTVLEFRAVGGDDDTMPWRSLDAVEPATLADVRLTVHPPEYTGRPVEQLPTGATQVQALLGSRIEFACTASKPLRSAELKRRDQPGVTMELAADGRSWTTSLILEEPGTTTVWFDLQDQEGFSSRDPLQFELRGQVDAIPDVVLQEPAHDLLVTPTASLPLLIVAHDDLGVSEMQLVWQTGEQSPGTVPLSTYTPVLTDARQEGTWLLEELSLKAGSVVVYRAEARDGCTVGPPHIGKSAQRMLRVVSADEKLQELATRAAEIPEELSEAARLQERVAAQVQELETQLSTAGELRPADRDLLNRLGLDQRQLSERLTDPLRGLLPQARRIAAELEQNGLISGADQDQRTEPTDAATNSDNNHAEELQTRLNELTESLDRLRQESLPAAERELTQAGKLLADEPQAAAKAGQQALAEARQSQGEVLDTLRSLQSDLGEWRAEQLLRQDVRGLLAEQQRLTESAAELAAQLLGKSDAELTPQQRADLEKLATRQRHLADRVEQWSQQLSKTDTADQRDASEAELRAEAADELQKRQPGAKLRQAAESLTANRLSETAQLQQQAEADLAAVRDALDPTDTLDAEQLQQRLGQTREQAAQLEDAEEMLRKHAEDETLGEEERQQLADQQRALRRQVEQLERQLERLRLRDAAEAAQRARQQMQQAEDELQEESDPGAAAESMEAAGDELQQLQREVAKAERELKAHLAQEEFERTASQLIALQQRQAAVIAETQRLESERQARGEWTRGQLRSLKDLAATERELAANAAAVKERLSPAPPFAAAVAHVIRALETASGRLEARDTGAETLALEQQALQRLKRLSDAWKESPPDPQAEMPPEEPPKDPNEKDLGDQAGPPGEAIPLQAQLRLLREWQADCLERTSRWDERRQAPPELTPAEQQQLTDLAAEQAEIHTLLKDLVDKLTASQMPPEPRPAANPNEKAPE